MTSTLIGFVVVYLVISIGIGVYAATRVHDASDYITAGRSLPMFVVIAMVFATWFGAETVLGIPATFLDENLGGTISDPFGATLCLVLFGLVFARPLYRMGLTTLGDFYRRRFNRSVEAAMSLAIALSYLGWVSAQVTALGLVFNVLPTFVFTHLPMLAQVVFFGALLSVIMSTASGTLLAPSVTISENLMKPFLNTEKLTDERFLWITRVVVALFCVGVTAYALWSLESATGIHQMVENAYKVTMATAFVPLFAGLFWSRANNSGAGASILLGLVVWLGMEFVAPEATLPAQFAGFLASAAGMIAGSLVPIFPTDRA